MPRPAPLRPLSALALLAAAALSAAQGRWALAAPGFYAVRQGPPGQPESTAPELPKLPPGIARDVDILQLPQAQFKGKVHIVNQETEDQVDWALLESAQLLGFDTETKPQFRKGQKKNPVALIQLATDSNCWIFQLLQPFGVSGRCQRRLQTLVESTAVVKAGVGIKEDCLMLSRTHMPTLKQAAGLLDLRDIVKPYKVKESLRALSATFLGLRLSKTQVTSNWASQNLSQAQVQYAATDAWVGFELHETLRGLFADSEAWVPPQISNMASRT